nr:cellulose biosynthesis protein BcsE [Raoultella sp. NCTC 9187]
MFYKTRPDGGWRLAQEEETIVQPRSDEKTVLSNLRVLEGAPALSEYWTLFDTNDAVFNAARTAQAATLLFSVTQNVQIEQLGAIFIPCAASAEVH